MDFKTFSLILHLFGLALGAGGAYMSDALFFYSIKDRKITTTELKFMELGSFLVWTGLAVLVVSGSGLFATDISRFLHASKFQAKMAILTVLVVNGLIFKFVHLPRIKRHAGAHYPSSDEFVRKAPWLLLSGVVSFISWTTIIILGTLPSIQFSFMEAMFIYFIVVLLSFVAAMGLKNRVFFKEY